MICVFDMCIHNIYIYVIYIVIHFASMDAATPRQDGVWLHAQRGIQRDAEFRRRREVSSKKRGETMEVSIAVT